MTTWTGSTSAKKIFRVHELKIKYIARDANGTKSLESYALD